MGTPSLLLHCHHFVKEAHLCPLPPVNNKVWPLLASLCCNCRSLCWPCSSCAAIIVSRSLEPPKALSSLSLNSHLSLATGMVFCCCCGGLADEDCCKCTDQRHHDALSVPWAALFLSEPLVDSLASSGKKDWNVESW